MKTKDKVLVRMVARGIAEKFPHAEASCAVFYTPPEKEPDGDPTMVYANVRTVPQPEVEAFIASPKSGQYSFAGCVVHTNELRPEGDFVAVAAVNSPDPRAFHPILMDALKKMERDYREWQAEQRAASN